jgi:hypothetical protein
MSIVMKKKVGTIVDDGLLAGAKQRAALEKRALADLIEEAISDYLERSPGRDEAMRALGKFVSYGGLLTREELDAILEEDTLSP